MSESHEKIGYKMVYGYTPDNLEQEVKCWLSEGWKPVGGPIVQGQDLYQAMIPVDGNYEIIKE